VNSSLPDKSPIYRGGEVENIVLAIEIRQVQKING